VTRAAARSLDVVEPSTAVTMESAACEIQYALVDRYVELDAARLLVESAAIQHDDGGDALLASRAALAAATSAAESATGDAIQFHGGIGFTFEHPAHLRSRWRWREQPVFKWLAGATAVVVAPALPLLLLVAATQRSTIPPGLGVHLGGCLGSRGPKCSTVPASAAGPQHNTYRVTGWSLRAEQCVRGTTARPTVRKSSHVRCLRGNALRSRVRRFESCWGRHPMTSPNGSLSRQYNPSHESSRIAILRQVATGDAAI